MFVKLDFHYFSLIVNCRTCHDILKFLHSAQEWNGFLGELQDTIQQQLAESHVQEFSDLSDAERLLFLDKGVRALNGSEFHLFPLSLSSPSNLTFRYWRRLPSYTYPVEHFVPCVSKISDFKCGRNYDPILLVKPVASLVLLQELRTFCSHC